MNLFGKMKPNQLMALLQQQQEQPQNPGAAFGQMMGGGAGMLPKAEGRGFQDFMNTPMGAGGDKPRTPFKGWTIPDYALKTNPFTLAPTLAVEKANESGGTQEKIGAGISGALQGKPVSDILDDIGKAPVMPRKEGESENEHLANKDMVSGPTPSALDQYMMEQIPNVPGASGVPSFGGMELIQNLGAEAQSRTKKQQDYRKEFESTPELDQLVAQTRGQLETAKGERKKPGLGEFLTLALMNLGNRDHRNNADMVLGTGEQREKERRLEDQLSQLEGGKASASMAGRREFRTTQRQEKQSALERMMQQQETRRKQGNIDRDYGLKKQGQDSGLLRSMAGQEAQVIGSATDPAVRKQAMDSRAKLKKLLGVDDAGLQRFIQQQQQMQQQQQAPQDERQSRMFGDLVGGGGYA